LKRRSQIRQFGRSFPDLSAIVSPQARPGQAAATIGTTVALSFIESISIDNRTLEGDFAVFTLKIITLLALIVAGAPLAVAAQSRSGARQADKSCTPNSLVGRYDIVSGEKEGVVEPKERIHGTIVTFTKDSVVVSDKDKKEIYSATYSLKPTTNPCEITMTSRVEKSAGEIARGLIEKDADTVRLIYALPTGEIPTGFKTKEKQLMFVMKKAE
jgi:uncharacterized protein (TIGR03067 family)